jgi:hypothetical protein
MTGDMTMQGQLKEQWKKKILAVALVLPLMAAGYGANVFAATTAPTQSPQSAATAWHSEVLISTAEEVAGTWGTDAGETSWMRLSFENGHFRYAFENESVIGGTYWVQDGKLTLATKTNTRTYLVFAKQEGGQPVQLRFVLMYQGSDWNPEVVYRGPAWQVNVDGKTLLLVEP